MRNHETKGFSRVLFGYSFRSNRILMLVITLVFCLFTVATNMAASLLSTNAREPVEEDTQQVFYTYLGVLAAYDTLTGSDLSYEGFLSNSEDARYDLVFQQYNVSRPEGTEELSREGFEDVIETIQRSDTDPETLVRTFEYSLALQGRTGIFTGEEMSFGDMVNTILNGMGLSSEDLERMHEMDFTIMITRVYYTAIGALILFLFVIISANGLIANQVDRGSMAYLLSAPNRRSAIALTQLVFLLLTPMVIMIIGCIFRVISTKLLFGEVNVAQILGLYLGMYILVQAIAGICYLCSCYFNESNRALAIGGGFAAWCFLASLLGMFGSEDLINMGIGVEALGIFNKLTLISLFDINAIQTIGTSAVDLGFVPKLIVLGVIAIVTYTMGALRFCRRDLPL